MPNDEFDRLKDLTQPLPTSAHPDSVHRYELDDVWAIRCALAARRALLVRGEPGTGKSQLARAAAATLGRPFTELVVDAHTSCHDLCFRFDAVERLAEAQIQGALTAADLVSGKSLPAIERQTRKTTVRQRLDPRHFVGPGPLWWALHWNSVATFNQRVPSQPLIPVTSLEMSSAKSDGAKTGVVVLIDEIDKAESDVPNGLLDVLGNGWFALPPCQGGGDLGRISHDGKQPFPLIIITTNEERDLPLAFRRRCLEHRLGLPSAEILIKRALDHFGPKPQQSDPPPLSKTLVEKAVEILLKSRQGCQEGEPKPGQAELMDWLRTIQTIAHERQEPPDQVMARVQQYHLRLAGSDAVQ